MSSSCSQPAPVKAPSSARRAATSDTAGIMGQVPQVDAELATARRRLRAAFGVVEVLEVVDHCADPDQPTAVVLAPAAARPPGNRPHPPTRRDNSRHGHVT
jgi:hypothetical protein